MSHYYLYLDKRVVTLDGKREQNKSHEVIKGKMQRHEMGKGKYKDYSLSSGMLNLMVTQKGTVIVSINSSNFVNESPKL